MRRAGARPAWASLFTRAAAVAAAAGVGGSFWSVGSPDGMILFCAECGSSDRRPDMLVLRFTESNSLGAVRVLRSVL